MSASNNVQADTAGAGGRVRPARRVGVARIVAGLATIGVASLGLIGLATLGGPTANAAVTAGTKNCQVTISASGSTASVNIISGCTGPDYWLASYSASSDVPPAQPQSYFASSNVAPHYTVALPPCFWQVDFTLRSGPPPNRKDKVKFIADILGGHTCTTSGSTTSTTPTTAPKTGVGGGTTTTSIKVVTPSTAASPSSASGAQTSGLAFTGFNAVPVVIAAFGAILAGMALVLSGTKRRRTI